METKKRSCDELLLKQSHRTCPLLVKAFEDCFNQTNFLQKEQENVSKKAIKQIVNARKSKEKVEISAVPMMTLWSQLI